MDNYKIKKFSRIVMLFGFSSLCILSSAKVTHALGFGTTAEGTYLCRGDVPAWNLRAADGLITVASSACDFQNSNPAFSGSSRAGVYGTDTSWSGQFRDIAENLSVEPMADASASVTAGCSSSIPGTGCASAYANSYGFIYATHRTRERTDNPLPPGLPNIIEILNNIPMKLGYMLHVSTKGLSNGSAAFSVSGPNVSYSKVIESGELEGSYSWTAAAGDIFEIRAEAGANAVATCAECHKPTHGEVQAIADPFAQVDPEWEYAQHFVVEQESLLSPGEWKEVTRNWMHFCECDLEPDADVDGTNLYAFILDYGQTDCSEGCPGDLNADGRVDEGDLVLFGGDFGKVNCK